MKSPDKHAGGARTPDGAGRTAFKVHGSDDCNLVLTACQLLFDRALTCSYSSCCHSFAHDPYS